MYYLLNKDLIIAKFSVDPVTEAINIEERLVKLPEWYGELDTFIINRRAPKHRENIKQLLPYAEEESEFAFGGEYFKDHGPRIGDDWIPAAVACLTAKTRKLLINLRGFEFTRHEKYNLPEWRLKALEKEMHDMINAILEKDALRTKQIAVKGQNRE